MLRKVSLGERFEKTCGNTIWCSSDEIITRQVLEDNPRKRPQMPCVSVVRLAKFEIHRRRRSVTEGSEIYSDKRQYLCTSCCGKSGWIKCSLQQKQSGNQEAFTVFNLHPCGNLWISEHVSRTVDKMHACFAFQCIVTIVAELTHVDYPCCDFLIQIKEQGGPYRCFRNMMCNYIHCNHAIIMGETALEEFHRQ